MCNNATYYYFVLWATFRSLEMQSKTRIGYILPNWRCIQIHSSVSLESNSVIFSSHVSLRKCFGPVKYILYMKMLSITITTLYYNATYIYICISYSISMKWCFFHTYYISFNTTQISCYTVKRLNRT